MTRSNYDAATDLIRRIENINNVKAVVERCENSVNNIASVEEGSDGVRRMDPIIAEATLPDDVKEKIIICLDAFKSELEKQFEEL